MIAAFVSFVEIRSSLELRNYVMWLMRVLRVFKS